MYYNFYLRNSTLCLDFSQFHPSKIKDENYQNSMCEIGFKILRPPPLVKKNNKIIRTDHKYENIEIWLIG